MKILFAVILPFVLQLLFTIAIIAATTGHGSFVGLVAMLTAMLALPLTALLNWLPTRTQPPLHPISLANRVFYQTLVFPVLMIVLAAVAS